MDPFTQRMLERAKLRREKLDNHFISNKGAENSDVLVERNEIPDNETEQKITKKGLTDIRKSKLQKLAMLYTENNENIPMEEKVEEEVQQVEIKNSPKRHKLKLDRLAELASKINQWEDDTNHLKSYNLNTCKNAKNKPSDSKKQNEKLTVLDSSTVQKLCSQGFSLSENQMKLTFNFEEEKKEGNAINSKKWEDANRFLVPLYSNEKSKCQNMKNENPVSDKVALFEKGTKVEQIKQFKDPAELPLAERRALFEKNLGELNVLPKKAVSHLPVFCANTSKTKQETSKKGSNSQLISEKIKDNNICAVSEPNLNKTTSHYVKEKVAALSEIVDNESVSKQPLSLNFSENKDHPELCTTREKSNSINERKADFIPKLPPMPINEIEDCKKTSEPQKKDGSSKPLQGGRLYPNLSNLDLTDISETTSSETEVFDESKDSDFCQKMSLTDLLEMNKNNPITPPCDLSFSKSKECQVLNKMDKLLENALSSLSSETEDECDEMLPSPPKMKKSTSFEYKSGIDENFPLLHTVSFYRKNQQCTPMSKESEGEEEKKVETIKDDGVLVENKIQILLTEVNKQQTIISQASQALNLCLSTIEFSGSGEQVEGERLLLLATHKRQACLNEIQRLKIENSLVPHGENNFLSERGDVILKDISVRLKRDALRAMAAAESLQYFVCLIKSDEQVLATSVVPATRENLKDLNLLFPGSIKLESLLSNFKVSIEVYNLELSKELLPHEVKYHIAGKKDKKLLTPIKAKKTGSKLVKPYIQSPAGPNAVRTSNFQMCGYIVFSLREVSRSQWMLNKVPYVSPLEGSLSMTIQSQLRLDDEFRGFLTMFDDISGFGAWHRRWCLLSSHIISFWKYPDDELKKVPIGTIDLRMVITENVGVVSRDVCARLHTFLLETTRPRISEDKNSLVLQVQENITTIRHLLSADSKQEMMTWCKKLNTTLALLRSWKCNFDG